MNEQELLRMTEELLARYSARCEIKVEEALSVLSEWYKAIKEVSQAKVNSPDMYCVPNNPEENIGSKIVGSCFPSISEESVKKGIEPFANLIGTLKSLSYEKTKERTVITIILEPNNKEDKEK